MSTIDLEEGNVSDLEIKSIVGFDGSTIKGFFVHPNKTHLVYPLGNKVTIQDYRTKEQVFLEGHTNIISALDVSKTGKFIASGQINHIGFKTSVIIWNFETHRIWAKYDLHQVRVEAVAFSKDERFCLSLGGRDCGGIVVWDIESNQAVCGAAASRGIQGEVYCLLTMNIRGACFATGGDKHLAIWKIDTEARNARPIDVNTGKIKRTILCMDVNERDEVCYCGTTTGDVIKVKWMFHHDAEILDPTKNPMVLGCFARITKKKMPRGNVSLYAQGVRSIRMLKKKLIIGGGDGTLELAEEALPKGKPPSIGVIMPSMPALRILKSTFVFYSVTSIQLLDNKILVGTSNSEIFSIDLDTFVTELLVTCHISAIYDLTFPHNFSEVFATASKNDVRVWSMQSNQELLRIRVENFSCSSVIFSYDGKSILTAWNDGIIRSFTPLTGRLIYAILNAHNKGVSALTISHKDDILLSGGCEGQVRVWSISPIRQQLICTLKEHKGPISAINMNADDKEAVSASTDGTCIIWDLVRLCRRQILFAKTLFMCVQYYPNGCQLLTGGSDRKIAYWEVLDGTLAREIEGSPSGAINSLDIEGGGEIFVTGGNDQIVKLWKYQEGLTTHIGLGHSAVITAVRFSPDGKYILTASASGSIFVWKNPYKLLEQPKGDQVKLPKPTGKRTEENIQDLPQMTDRSGDSKSGKSGKNKSFNDIDDGGIELHVEVCPDMRDNCEECCGYVDNDDECEF